MIATRPMMECLVMVLKVKLNQCLNATLHAQPKRFDEVSRYFGLATRLLLLVMLLVSSAGLRAQSPLNPGLPYGMSGTVLPGGLLPGGGLMPGVGLLPGSVSGTQQTPGSPRSSLALQCPPGTQGISCLNKIRRSVCCVRSNRVLNFYNNHSKRLPKVSSNAM